MALAEPFDWDEGFHSFTKGVNREGLLSGAEMLDSLEKEFGVLGTDSAWYTDAERSVLEDNREAIQDFIANYLVTQNLKDSPHTYEYRGDFMVVGMTFEKQYSYSASYFPRIEGKRDKIYVSISSMLDNCRTLVSTTIKITPPLD